MRYLLAALIFSISFSSLARADTSGMIRDKGLAGAEAELAALDAPTPDEQFALGGVRFLRAIEKTLQTRWRHNAVLSDLDMPVLRLPVPPNPAPEPFEAGLITGIFSTLRDDLSGARTALEAVPEGAELGLRVALADLWFDINANSSRDRGEGMMEVGSVALLGRMPAPGEAPEPPTVRFDTADLPWLIAYTHLLSGVSELVLAFDPTDAIAEVMAANRTMDELRGEQPPMNMYDVQFGRMVDQFAMAYTALNRRPDAAHTRAAHAHLLAMIEQNRRFWALLEQETDNEAEWIPNATQTAALGFDLPPDTGVVWQEVLADAEALLKGDKLIPYWRVSPGAGLNLRKLFTDPPVVEPVAWVQGMGLVSYLERGTPVSPENWRRFLLLAEGESVLFAMLLN